MLLELSMGSWRRGLFLCSVALAALIELSGTASPSWGATLTWDSSGANAAAPVDGSGNWDITSLLWSNGASDVAWNNAGLDTAVFGNNGTAGTVALTAPITVAGITFNAVGT